MGVFTDCSILQSYFKLSKMQVKKKSGLVPSKNQQSSGKLSNDVKHGVRKSFQKHSRKGTKDYQPINLLSLVNARLYSSARELMNRNHIENINSIIFGYSSIYALQLKQAIALSYSNQHLQNYFILSKHKSEYGNGKITIEAALVESIQGKNHLQFVSRPNMHFESRIYSIMGHHMLKRKKYLKKMSMFQNHSSVHREKTPWTKQLPTLVSDRDNDDSEVFDKKRYTNSYGQNGLNTSESFQLKKLTECIKDMFNRQIFDVNREKITVWTGGQNSWLIQGKSIQKKPLLECDFSSIQSCSKYDLQMDSKLNDRWTSDVQENYGLGSLRRKYEEQQRESKLKQSSEIKSKPALGHKRNPTETLHTKQYLMEEPLTPKENYRSVFTSSQNIILNSPRNQKSKSKNKDFDVNEAYLLRFDKKKTNGHPNTKQNQKKQKSKVKSEISKSKSKQKLKFATKKK